MGTSHSSEIRLLKAYNSFRNETKHVTFQMISRLIIDIFAAKANSNNNGSEYILDERS